MEKGNKNAPMSEEKAEEIVKTGSVVTKNEGKSIHSISIIGQVEGHYVLGENQKSTKYEHLIPLLVAIEESEDIDGLLVILNTMGGDVEAGLALAEMIASMSKPTVSLVLGGGHSIGVPLAVAAKRSFIVPSATMTIHPVRTSGLVIGVPQTFRHFAEMQKRITDFVCRHSAVKAETLECLMMNPDDMANDVGTILGGKEAVSHGIIDQVGGLSDAIAALRNMIKHEKNKQQ